METDRIILRLTKVYDDESWTPPPLLPLHPKQDIEQVKQAITGLARSIGEYERPVHLNRAIALLLTPMAVSLGRVDSDDCPPYDITPAAARERFRALLTALYGERLTKRSCRIF